MLSALSSGLPVVMAVAALYGLALVIGGAGSLKQNRTLIRFGFAMFVAAFALNTLVIGARWADGGRPPFKTLYETLVFYPWCVAVVTFFLVGMYRLYVLVPFSAAFNVAGLIYALSSPDVEIINLPPALQSAWFVPHVVTYFVAYAALFASFALAVLALAQPWWREKRGSDKPAIDFESFAHQATLFGLSALTLGLVMGAVWGKVAWGDYWSWDPKENWALVSWLAYMIYLHLRYKADYRGTKAMWVLVLAFGAVVFTYLGVSMLPTSQASLHVYQ